MTFAFLSHHAPLVRDYTELAPPPPAPVPAPPSSPLPPSPTPIAFSAVSRPSLFGIVSTAISSTTLATITCADADMTVSLSEPVPGLTFAYSSNVLSVSGTPTAPTGLHRVVVSYLSSDDGLTIRGSTSHEILIVSAGETLAIGDMAGAAGRVGRPLSATLASPTTNWAVDVTASASGVVPGASVALAWTKGVSSGSGTLTITGTPTDAGTYSLSVTYRAFGVELGTSTHEVVISPAYTAAPPPPAPAPAPPAPSPSPPPVPSPAPSPGTGPDTLFSSVKVLMHFDTATGIATDVNGNTFTNHGVTSTTGSVGEAGLFTGASTYMEGSVSGIDGTSGNVSVECMVEIGAAAWAAMTAAGDEDRYCPVMTLLDTEGRIVWTLGFGGYKSPDFPRNRVVVGMKFAGLTSPLLTAPSVSGTILGEPQIVNLAYQEMTSRPARFVHLAGGHKVTGSAGQFLQGAWFDGRAGGVPLSAYMAQMRTASTGTLRIGGLCPGFRFVRNNPSVLIVPFAGVVDEVRVTAAARHSASLTVPRVLAIGAEQRVIPWPNY